MNPKIIVLDTSKCSKCNDCINICAEIHGISRIRKYSGIPIFCMQCETAPCKEICPVNAIYLKENIPIVDKDKCIGCGMCAIACPIGAIFIENKVAHKCTLCLDADRITPACIEACKDNALKLICDESLEMIKEEKRRNLIKIISENFEEL
jgi:Fe-S-cluster-containing hydrogenase component 2